MDCYIYSIPLNSILFYSAPLRSIIFYQSKQSHNEMSNYFFFFTKMLLEQSFPNKYTTSCIFPFIVLPFFYVSLIYSSISLLLIALHTHSLLSFFFHNPPQLTRSLDTTTGLSLSLSLSLVKTHTQIM
jgi:hypothetical protein